MLSLGILTRELKSVTPGGSNTVHVANTYLVVSAALRLYIPCGLNHRWGAWALFTQFFPFYILTLATQFLPFYVSSDVHQKSSLLYSIPPNPASVIPCLQPPVTAASIAIEVVVVVAADVAVVEE
ncbi:hypothetical protein Pcinc_040832 [Petrolisthes cinctipes]|uniref:Uncharacterized protein n=1 Tax=Petrolisthes cinctipes TaxID=88211 RepID=A0AAE1BNU0_PETCI|nr:hypothetical protein Pcinc_040832 [Petrolisthes cinctipes]